MALTSEQIATLKAGVIANPTAAAMRTAGDVYSLHLWLNAPTDPAVLAWRNNVPPQDADQAPSYSTFDSIVAGKRDSWGFFLAFPRDFARAKVRNWVVDVWGSAGAASNAEAILLAGTEPATNAEAIFGGTQRTTGTVSALDRLLPGAIIESDVNQLIN
jgi:hypothetical protein